jgi:D-alanyl-lipoteichoic acid acyltransferase DltB (MBOAT superfamily)
MLFASFDFLLFLPPVLGAYWLLAHRPRARFLVLVVASYFFYCAGAKPAGGALPPAWYFVGLLALTTWVDFTAALLMRRSQERGGTGRGWLIFSLVFSLGLLGYFKYTRFALEVAEGIAAASGLPWTAPTLRIALPIGISFYTFQSMSYTIDVWRRKLEPERSLLRYAMYVAFFPQLVAGPILRATEFLPQLGNRPRLTRADVDFALYRITKGIFKKAVLGDLIAARFTDLVFSAPADYSSAENLIALYAFTLQIYADFSGYSDVAIGVARLFGFQFPENFDRPYRATSVADFWRRWHITLSTWLRDYLFFPLGGSRLGLTRTCVNLWVTLFLIGMWHGASYNFLIYANLQAAAIVLHRIVIQRSASAWGRVATSLAVAAVVMVLGLVLGRILELGPRAVTFFLVVSAVTFVLSALAQSERKWLEPVHVVLTFHFVVLGRIFFRAESLDAARVMSSRLLEMDGLGLRAGLFRFHQLYAALEVAALPPAMRAAAMAVADQGILVLLVVGLLSHFVPRRLTDGLGERWFSRAPHWAVAATIAALGAVIPQLLSGPRPNIYFAF